MSCWLPLSSCCPPQQTRFLSCFKGSSGLDSCRITENAFPVDEAAEGLQMLLLELQRDQRTWSLEDEGNKLFRRMCSVNESTCPPGRVEKIWTLHNPKEESVKPMA
ncbi:hypothetical protein ILYODFUR_034120 [Ilyodon furcidens]|uniref:Uncharacterized protein n=1 Tax=Ilyodon furcidens TaxID=33524 RepID=A0ABV0T2R9_9TELE